jgi:hypothetical protein
MIAMPSLMGEEDILHASSGHLADSQDGHAFAYGVRTTKVVAWQAIVIVITLLTAASTIVLASRAIREAVQTRAVFFADKKWAIDKHPAIACLVAIFWLSLVALVIFALAVVITDLPAVIKAIFQI